MKIEIIGMETDVNRVGNLIYMYEVNTNDGI